MIDCDLQHPPEVILDMYRLWKEGYEVVEGVKSDRGKESLLYKVAAKGFYHMISNATGIDMRKASDFKLLDRKVIDALLAMPEKQVFFRALSSWVGFKSTKVAFQVQKRTIGKTKWSAVCLIKYALSNISSFSSAPMQIVTMIGGLFLVFSIVFGIQTLVQYGSGKALEGFTTVILLLLLIGSILMISMGVIGYYISKIYNEVKCRPRYIVTQSLNDEKGEQTEFAGGGKTVLTQIYKKYQEIIDYLIAGGLTTVVSMVLFYGSVGTVLDGADAAQLQAANIFSWCGAVIFAYWINRVFVFKSCERCIMKELLVFAASRIITLLLDMAVMLIGTSILGGSYQIMKLLSMIFVMLGNYMISKFGVFSSC